MRRAFARELRLAWRGRRRGVHPGGRRTGGRPRRGWRDGERRQQWGPDTLVNFYSVGKAVLGLLALQLVDDGVVGLDDPIASVGPGSPPPARAAPPCGTPCATAPACRRSATGSTDEDLWSWQTMTDARAGTEPFWEPGTRHAYHTNTYGHLVGEVVRQGHRTGAGTRLRTVAAAHRGRPVVRGAGIRTGPLRRGRFVGRPTTTCGGCRPACPGRRAHDDAELFQPPGYPSSGRREHSRGRSKPRCPPPTATAPAVEWPASTRRCSSRARASDLAGRGPLQTPVGGYVRCSGEEVTFGSASRLTMAPADPSGPTRSSFGHFGTGGGVRHPASGVRLRDERALDLAGAYPQPGPDRGALPGAVTPRRDSGQGAADTTSTTTVLSLTTEPPAGSWATTMPGGAAVHDAPHRAGIRAPHRTPRRGPASGDDGGTPQLGVGGSVVRGGGGCRTGRAGGARPGAARRRRGTPARGGRGRSCAAADGGRPAGAGRPLVTGAHRWHLTGAPACLPPPRPTPADPPTPAGPAST